MVMVRSLNLNRREVTHFVGFSSNAGREETDVASMGVSPFEVYLRLAWKAASNRILSFFFIFYVHRCHGVLPLTIEQAICI